MASKKITGWFTMNGKHIPLFEGESKKDAVNRSLKKPKAGRTEPVTKKSLDDAWDRYEKKALAAEYDIQEIGYESMKSAAREFDIVVDKANKNGVIKNVKFNGKPKDKTVKEAIKDKADKKSDKPKDYFEKGNSRYSLSKSGNNTYLIVGSKDGKGASFKYKVAYAKNPEKARANLGGTGSMAYLNFKDHPELIKLLKNLK